MSLSLIIFSALVALGSSAKNTAVISARDAFISSGIVPDLIPEPPMEKLDISYKSKVTAELGKELTPRQVKDEPTVSWKADPKALYTLMLVDADPPTRENPDYRSWMHWLVTNIPGKQVNKGDEAVEYIGSGAEKDTGFHRYTFLLFKQPERIDAGIQVRNNTQKGRSSFQVQAFADEFSLSLVAGNFYMAQFDDYVPILAQQTSF